jgi:hypothetical protein
VVLADLARARTARRAANELAHQSAVSDALLRGLVRAQLAHATRLVLVVAVGLGGLPLLFSAAPMVADSRPFGIALPWLLLGVAAYPFLLAVGAAYVRLSHRTEAEFADLVRHAALLRRPETDDGWRPGTAGRHATGQVEVQ